LAVSTSIDFDEVLYFARFALILASTEDSSVATQAEREQTLLRCLDAVRAHISTADICAAAGIK
jgi:hypothetical protein